MVLNAQTSYPHDKVFVLKLHQEASPANGRLVGRIEHVATGHQCHFGSGEELLACLVRGDINKESWGDEKAS